MWPTLRLRLPCSPVGAFFRRATSAAVRISSPLVPSPFLLGRRAACWTFSVLDYPSSRPFLTSTTWPFPTASRLFAPLEPTSSRYGIHARARPTPTLFLPSYDISTRLKKASMRPCCLGSRFSGCRSAFTGSTIILTGQPYRGQVAEAAANHGRSGKSTPAASPVPHVCHAFFAP